MLLDVLLGVGMSGTASKFVLGHPGAKFLAGCLTWDVKHLAGNIPTAGSPRRGARSSRLLS